MAVRAWNSIELCAGVGGLGLGVSIAEPGHRSVAYVEREAYAASLLVARMEAGELDAAPVWSDLTTFDGRPWSGRIHLVTSGDPCQPNSNAGKRGGVSDDRFLIDQVLRVLNESGADRLFRENVTGNADGQLHALVDPLERMGFVVAAGIWRASDVGASHGRERLFVMADRIGGRFTEQPQLDGGTFWHRQGLRSGRHAERCPDHTMGDAESGRWHAAATCQGTARSSEARGSGGELGDPLHAGLPDGARLPFFAPGPTDSRWSDIIGSAPELEPAVRRVAHGMANRVDELRACGNGVVSLAAAYAWRTLNALHADRRAAEAFLKWKAT